MPRRSQPGFIGSKGFIGGTLFKSPPSSQSRHYAATTFRCARGERKGRIPYFLEYNPTSARAGEQIILGGLKTKTPAPFSRAPACRGQGRLVRFRVPCRIVQHNVL